MLRIIPLFAVLALFQAKAQPTIPDDWQLQYATGFDTGRADDWQWYSNLVGGAWAVEKDGDNFVLSGSATNIRYPAFHKTGAWSDFYVKARFQVLAGAIQIDYRYSPCGGYWLRLGPTERRFYRQADCTAPQRLPDLTTSVETGRWYTIEILGVGGNLKAFLDGTKILDYTDPDPVTAGGIAFEPATVGSASRIRIDDVEVRAPRTIQTISWVRTGGPLGGTGYDIRMHPNNPDLLYVTEVSTGVSISTDGGQTWAPSNAGIVSRAGATGDAVPVFCLTIDQNNPDTIWAGTQNLRGIYKSTDGGKNWVQKDNGVVESDGITFRGFTVDPRDSNVVYAAGQVSSIIWAGQSIMSFPFDHSMGVVYKTTDGGENWSAIWRGDCLARYIWLDYNNPDTIYVSTGFWDVMAANTDDSLNFAGGVGILKSTDGGATWRVLNEANGLKNLFVGSLFMHPRDPRILLAGAGNNRYKQGRGVYLTTDGGETWTQTLATTLEITAVEFASSDPNIAYAMGSGWFYRSKDGGRTWTLIAGPSLPNGLDWGPVGVRSGIPSDIQVDPRNPDRLFVNSYVGGNFLTEDGGKTWADASRGYTGANLSDVAVDPTDHRRVYSMGRSGPFRSDDGGETWQGLYYKPSNSSDWLPGGGWGPPEWSSVAIDPANSKRVLFSDEMTGILLLGPDYGLNWTISYREAAAGTGNNQGFKALAFSAADPSVVYAGMCADCRQRPQPVDPSYGIYKSTDGGGTWAPANDDLTARLNIHRLAVDPRTSQIVYAGSGDHGILRSMDGGASWSPINKGLGVNDVRAIAIDPVQWWVIYAGTFGGGVYRSEDAGATWKLSNSGLGAQSKIVDIVIDPVQPNVLYAADGGAGVFRSEDGGKFWVALNKGLTTKALKALAISSDGGTLYAATDGGGVFRFDILPFDR